MLGTMSLPHRNRLLGAISITLVLASVLGAREAQAAAGRIKEFIVPSSSSHPGGIVLGPDGAVWFTEIATNAIDRFANRTFTRFPLPQGGEPLAITNGSDGALWFVEYAGERVGRITTDGQITEYSVPGAGPWDIAAGPDGALWFTELDADRIGRITTAGSITHFSLPAQDADPLGIANGPDGALWFTDGGGVARITTDGTVTHEWSGTSGNGITTGPDGNVWFMESSSDLAARLNPANGQVSTFRIDIGCFPQEIASGSGSLWFTCYFLDEVGRVTVDGQVTAFPVPNHFHGNYPDTLEGIVAGAGNDMWFTEEAANRIGRISTS